MACPPDACNILGEALQEGACDKESALDVVGLQRVQYLFHTVVLVGSGKDQCELTACGVGSDDSTFIYNRCQFAREGG